MSPLSVYLAHFPGGESKTGELGIQGACGDYVSEDRELGDGPEPSQHHTSPPVVMSNVPWL